MTSFHVEFGANLVWRDGTALVPALLEQLDQTPGLTYRWLTEKSSPVTPAQIRGVHTLVVSGTKVDASTLAEGAQDTACVCLWSLGYDNVDLDACTAAGVAVTRIRGATAPMVAAGALCLMLSLVKRQADKERIVRQGRWDLSREFMGGEIHGKVLGIVGLGDIGRELARIVRAFDMHILAADPYVDGAVFERLGVERTTLADLLARSDIVSLHCNLTAETRGLIGAPQLALLKPTAYLVNTARGPIVDQKAIAQTLLKRRISGAALDVFEVEPLPLDDPLLRLDNVILTNHGIGSSWEALSAGAMKLLGQLRQLARGDVPDDVLNSGVIETPAFRAKLGRWNRPAQ